ncbi:Mu transposase C-terminal domain-containing protein [Sutterella wadsworthensis]|uniref:Mu transposase domain-containing protein n=1 Tax=Sutterella wadsworthensis TaxID=40545 RepID=UPI0032C0B392
MRLREETRKVDKTGLIQVDGRHYRVPDEYSQKDVQILMDDHSIMVYRKGDFVIELDKERGCKVFCVQAIIALP